MTDIGDWFIPILVVLAIVTFFKWSRSKKQQSGIAKAKHPVAPMPMPPSPPLPRQAAFDFSSKGRSSFDSVLETSVLNKVSEMAEIMKEQDSVITDDMLRDLESLKKKLVEVTRAKGDLQRYGREMGLIYDRYDAREHQLKAMIAAMEGLAKTIPGKKR